MDMVRSMMSYSNMPNLFCSHALEIAAHILKLVPSKLVPITPTKMSNGRKTSLQHV